MILQMKKTYCGMKGSAKSRLFDVKFGLNPLNKLLKFAQSSQLQGKIRRKSAVDQSFDAARPGTLGLILTPQMTVSVAFQQPVKRDKQSNKNKPRVAVYQTV